MRGNMTVEHKAILDELELEYATLHDVPDLSKPG